MNKNKSKSFVSFSDTLSLGIALGLIYWCLDASIDVYISNNKSFWGAFLSPNLEQIWTRSLIFGSMITFSFVVRLINNNRKSAENALIESEDRFRSLVIGSTDGIIIHNGKCIIETNQKLADMLGYELQKIIGDELKNFFDEESQKRINENLQNKNIGLFQATAIRKNGNKVTFEIVNREIIYNGKPFWISTVTDCSVPDTKTEDAEKDSNHYHKLLQNSNDPLFVYGLTNENNPDKFLEASKMACTKFGYTLEEYKNLNIIEILVPEERDNILPVFQTLIDFKHSIFETEILTKNKERVPIEISSHLFDLDSRPMIISTLREITERKKADQLLRESEHQYHRLFDDAPVAYFSLNPNGNIIDVNDKWCSSFGFLKEEIIDSWFGDFLTRPSLDRFRASFTDLIESKEPMEIDLEICNKDKSITNILMIAKPTQSNFGDIQTAQCILLDNSLQKDQTDAKLKQKQWLEQIIDNTSDIVFSFKPDGTIININPAFEKILDNSQGSFIDSKLDSLIHPDDMDFLHQAINKCIEGEKIPSIEIRLQTVSEDYVPAEMTMTPFYQEDEIIGIDCLVKDISKPWQRGNSNKNILEEYQKQIETLPDYACIIDRNLKVIYTNKKHQELTEKIELKADIIGHDAIEVYPFESEDSRSIYTSAFDKATTIVREISYSVKDTQFVFESKIVPIYAGDEILYAFLITKDISSQRHSVSALKASEEELSVIFNNTSAILALVDKDLKVHKINRSGLKYTGHSKEEMLGKRGGEALGCLHHLDDPNGCGFGPNCDKCPVRNTIAKTFKTGLNHHNISATLPFKIDGIEKNLHVLISTNVIDSGNDDLILVAIENITGQKMAEESLHRSEQAYRTLTQNLPGMVYRVHCREKNRMQFFNDLVESLTGYSENELVNGEICSIEKFIHNDDLPKVSLAVQEAIKEKKSFEVEYRLHHKNGDIKYFIERGQPVFDVEGSIKYIDGVIFDVSERKEVEEAYRESEEKYRQIIENATEGILVTQDGWLKFVNPQMEKFAGYSAQELLSKPFVEFIHQDDRELVIENHRKRMAGEPVSKTYSFRIYTKNDEIRWFEIGGIEIKWEGKPASLNFFLDITERKQTEEKLKNIYADLEQKVIDQTAALRESEERLELALEGAQLGTWDWNMQTGKVIFNKRWCEILGYSLSEIEPHVRAWEKLIHPDDTSQIMEILNKNLAGETPFYECEQRLLTKSGEYKWVQALGKVVEWDEDGKALRHVGTEQDINDRKQAEEELNNYRSNLEDMVEKRTTELSNANESLNSEIEGHKQTEKKLRTSKEKYRTLITNIPNVVWTSDENGHTSFISPNIEDVYGYTAEEIYEDGKTLWYGRIHPDDIDNVKSDYENLLNNNQQYDIEYRIQRKDGQWIWIHDRAIKTHDNEGIVRVDGVFADITNRKQTEATLQKLSSRNKALLEAVPDIIVEVDANKVFTWVNKAGFDFFGEDVLGKEAAHYFIGEQDTYETVNPLFEGDDNIIYVESWQRRIDGEKRLLAWWCQVIKDENGNVTGALSTARDITEIKMAEEKLQNSEEKFRGIVESSVDGISLINRDCTIIEWNQGQEKITGLKKDDVLGTYIYDMQYQLMPENRQSDENYQMIKSAMQEVSKTGESPYMNDFMETDISLPDGTIRMVEILSFPIKTDDGFMICSITRDITDKKLLENEHSKTEKLESIGVLAGGIAHDFNNILTAILGNISLAKMDTVPDSDINTRLVEAEKASERAQDLTRQLLTFSKGGAPVKKTISIRNVINESVGFALHGSNVKSIFNIEDDLSMIDADTGQISQVINNLIINANQAMPNGGTITVSANDVEISKFDQIPLRDGQYVRIEIRDEGTGIPKEYLQRIFDPYFTTKQTGSGLGLATTYSIIKNHNGHIVVESKSGEGTSFCIHLPVSDKPAEIEIKEEDVKLAGGGKILVMDDEETIRMVTGVTLIKAGYKVEFAADGKEAVDKYKLSVDEGSPFDLIFMDLTIPGGMGGQEALEQIKEIDPDAKAIVSSGYSNNPVMADHEKFGFCGVITKPYKAENLIRIVYQILHVDKIPV
ncbi:MAG: PAS domain S-box protein [candidate division Zixibacteria bacterium]|nr:PAS domain S-box protein [candidate division Zixibacteria bacterium]